MNTTDILTDAFARIPDIARRAVDGASAEELAYRPDPDANSIAWLLWHLTRVQDHHVSQLSGRTQAYLEEGWAARLGMDPNPDDTGYGHTSDQVDAVRFDEPEVVLAYLDAVQARTLEYVRSADAAELGRIVDTRWDPPVTAGVRLVSVIGDCLQHLGQASYIRGMWERLEGS